MDPTLAAQIKPYLPWLIIGGVIVLFILLRVARKALRQRVDEIGYRLRGDSGLMIWFWMNAPGVVLHELSHAFVILLFRPFGFRVTSIALFRIKPVVQRGPDGRAMKSSGKRSLQLGEVQYTRPPNKFMTHIGDGLSATAPLFGGLAMLLLLYWVATGYNLWDIHLQILRPGWPWWTLIFAPYLILTVTSELWPSHQDWRGARWLLIGLFVLAIIIIVSLWLTKLLVFNDATLQAASSIATHLDYALLVLLGVEIIFFVIADVIARFARG